MKKISFLLIILSVIIISISSFKKQANPFLGKWELVSKIELKQENGVKQELNEKFYKKGKKIYEFQLEDKLVITDDFGKTKEKKKYVYSGSNLYIGKEQTENNLYVYSFTNPTSIKLVKTKQKVKENITYLDTEELVLHRIQATN